MKSKFKVANLAASVALAAGAATISLPASAVSLSDNGLGQVGLVPFYTTRGNDTYFSIVNTDPVNAIFVKLRFREADNSRDARDFNIALSPNDVWTGVVTQNADGIPLVQTGDTSCTGPSLLESAATNPGMRGITFTDIDYNGGTGLGQDAAAAADIGIDRTEDGHFEIIMMGVSEPEMGAATPEADRNVAGYATHDSGYFDCGVVAAAFSDPTVAVAGMSDPWGDEISPPLDVMKVAANFIDVDSGVAAMIPSYMLQGFSPIAALPQPPASANPNLNDAAPAATAQIIDGVVVQDSFSFGVDAVSSLMMATSVLNEYAIGGGGEALYDWVVTFPTKNFYVDATLVAANIGPIASPNALPPFTDWFQDVDPVTFDIEPGNGLSCESVSFGYYDREENDFTPSSPPDFSPLPEGQPDTSSLCYEVQTLEFGDGTVLNGRNAYGVPLENGFTSGWMRLTFTGDAANNDGIQGSNTYYGLPTLSFGVKTYTNGVADTGGVLNYGFTQPAAYDRDGTY